MRSAASNRGIKSITVEIGNPQQFQNQFIQWSYQGIFVVVVVRSTQNYHAPPPSTPQDS